MSNKCYIYKAIEDNKRIALAMFVSKDHTLYYMEYNPSAELLIKYIQRGLDRTSDFLMYESTESFRKLYEPVEVLEISE